MAIPSAICMVGLLLMLALGAHGDGRNERGRALLGRATYGDFLQIRDVPALCQPVTASRAKKERKSLGSQYHGLKVTGRTTNPFTYPQFASMRGKQLILKGFGLDFFERKDEILVSRSIKHALEKEGNPSEDAVLDIGMNLGYYSLLSLSYGYKVHAVEMQGMCHRMVMVAAAEDGKEGNLVLHQNVMTSADITIPVAKTRCKTGTFDSTNPNNNWLRRPQDTQLDNVKSLAVDDLVEQCGLKSLAFTKLDVDGAEIQVLESMRRSLKAGVIKQMIVEVNGAKEWSQVGTTREEGVRMLNWLVGEVFPYTYTNRAAVRYFENNECPPTVRDGVSLLEDKSEGLNALFRTVPLPGCQ